MANLFCNSLDVPTTYGGCMKVLCNSKLVSYFGIGLTFVLILCLVHLLTTLYEHSDKECANNKPVESNYQLASRKTKLRDTVATTKRALRSQMKLEIERKFSQSLMNQSYSFPRKSA